MGLDMYIMEAAKPRIKATAHIPKLEEMQKTYTMFPAKNPLPDGLKDLEPFMVPIRVNVAYYAVRKIKKAFNMPHTPHCCGFGPDGAYFWCKGMKESVTIPHEDIDRLYTRRAYEQYYAVKLTEVGYWRKNYPLQEFIHNSFPFTPAAPNEQPRFIENCGYYRLTKEMAEKIRNRTSAESFRYEIDNPNYFYHEWY